MKMAFRSFLRNGKVTLISTAAVLAMAVFLMVFANSIRLNQASLDDAFDNLEVNAYIRASTALSEPYLDEARCLAILDSGFVGEYSAMVRFKQSGSAVLRGVNSPAVDSLLEEALEYTHWQAGYDQTILQGTEPLCLAPAASGLELGETVEFFLLDKDTVVTLTVVGLYTLGYKSDTTAYYCPLNWLTDTCHALGVPVNYNGLEMRLTNLRQLDDFKARMKELEMDSGGAILVINDALLREVTAQLQRQIRLLESVLPVLLALVAGIGFGLSFLLLRGRKKEAAVMRSLGMKRGRVFSVLLLENLFQALLGGILGCAATAVLLGAEALQIQYAALLLACYLVGGGIAIWKLSGVNVFTIMTAKE